MVDPFVSELLLDRPELQLLRLGEQLHGQLGTRVAVWSCYAIAGPAALARPAPSGPALPLLAGVAGRIPSRRRPGGRAGPPTRSSWPLQCPEIC